MSCLYVREEIQASEMQDNRVHILPLCHFVPASLWQMCTHSQFFLSLSTLMQGNKHNIKVSSFCTEGMVNRKDLSSLQEGLRVHSRDLSLQEQLLNLLLCNGKDTVLTSHRALFEGWNVQGQKMNTSVRDTLQCTKHSKEDVWKSLKLEGNSTPQWTTTVLNFSTLKNSTKNRL